MVLNIHMAPLYCTKLTEIKLIDVLGTKCSWTCQHHTNHTNCSGH